MAYQVGYWVDLHGVTLSDDENLTTTFQAMPYGEYDHPIYGKINLTIDKAKAMAQNIVNRVRGTDLDIDYDHKQDAAKGSAAAGWVQAAEAREDGLWLTVKWTKGAWDAIKAGEWRYFSPEFHDEWTHPKTKEVHKDVLFGGALTNRPFLKDIMPLNMSELFEEQANQQQEEGTGMDPKKLRKLLGLPEDATDEQVEKAIADAPEGAVIGVPPEEPANDKGDKGDKPDDQSSSQEPQTIAASEGATQEVIKRLTESTDPNVKALAEMVGALQTTVQTQGVALQLAETDNVIKRLSEPKDGKVLPASSLNAMKEILLKAPKAMSDDIVKLFEGLRDAGGVELNERGSEGDHRSGEGDNPTKKFTEKVEAMVKEDKISFGEATERVAKLHPDLYEGHRQGSYAFREN